MSLRNETLTFNLLLSFVLFCNVHSLSTAASVYAIPKHWNGATVNVYDILEGNAEGELEYRATYDLLRDGAADVMIDTRSNILFISFEDWEYLQLVNARTFLSEGTAVAQGADDLAGLELDYVDPNTTLLYTVDRGKNKLFVYEWDADEKELTLLPYSPKQKWYTLLPYNPEDNPVFACGLALDEADGTLYVSQFKRTETSTTYSNIVYAYDPNVSAPDPNDRFRCTRKIDLGQDNNAVDIDVHSANGWLYAGGYASHQNLIRFDLDQDDPCAPDYDGHIQPIGAGVIGLSVSQGTNMVYMTTYNQELEAWDTDMWTKIDSEDIGNGAGVCVAEAGYVPPFEVVKVDDVVGCASPRGEEIKYTISVDYQWDEVGYTDPNIIDSIEVVDYLPAEVNFISAQPDDGLYEYDDPDGPRYTWGLTDANSFGDTLSFELVVRSQNERLTPGGMIENNVEVIATINEGDHIGRFTLQTPVCDCTGYTEVIYVDADVQAQDPNGSSWSTAFDDLTDALNAAWPCDQIWVAEGTYTPQILSEPNMYFDIPRYVSLLGGFWGDETESYERNWADPCNETILSGDEDLDYVVNINVEQALVDGFTIKDCSLAGVYCERSSPLILHNKIADNAVGIYCFKSEQPVIKNNWIYRNDYGLYFYEPAGTATVRNNTVVNNTIAGIYMNTGQDPEISNCIIWGHPKGYDLVDCNSIYSCITDGDIGQGNIDGDPNYPPFVNGADDDYHLEPNSPCTDVGDPDASYSGERDIDKHLRVLDGDGDDDKRVDMGADEYCDEGYDNDADFNLDDIVDTNDLRELAAAWLIDDSDPCWATNYDKYDLNTDDVINYGDFAYFAKEWLWMTCEKMQGYEMMEMMMGMGGGMAGAESMVISEPAPLAPTAAQKEASEMPAEQSVEKQIEQIKQSLNWLYEVRETIDEETWLSLTGSLEEMLKELENSQ